MRGTRHRGKQTNIIADRFRLWREDRRERLVELWQSDRARSLRYRHSRGVSSQEQRRIQQVEAALTLVREGEMSAAMSRLHSLGIADLTPGVLQ